MTRADQSNLSKRIAQLSVEKRELLRKLAMRENATAGPSLPPAPGPEDPLVISRDTISVDEGKEHGRQLFELVNQNLDRTPFATHAVFLNFGYVANENPRLSPIQLPRYCLNRNSVQLALEVIADVQLSGRTVVDVGCGRGGTIAAMKTYFSPGLVVGVDFSRSAIAFCRRTHRFERTRFVEGNAQELPLGNARFCVLTSIESACGYSDIERFFGEALRVLRPGGLFLYADVVPRKGLTERRQLLTDIGFVVESERDITSNVILSCDETAKVHRTTLGGGHEDEVVDNFLGSPDSNVYQQMSSGELVYLIYKAKRTGA